MMKVILKIGGSLIDESAKIIKIVSDHFAGSNNTQVIVVPGGSIFANNIREVSEKYSITEEAAHWMAIAAMEQYAYLLKDLSGIETIQDIEDIHRPISILLPYRILKEMDELPHSWDITSDSIAAWVAHKINAKLVKVTDVDGILKDGKLIEEISRTELVKMGQTCADRMLPTLLENYEMECVIVNGNHPERVLQTIEGKKVIGTYIKGNI